MVQSIGLEHSKRKRKIDQVYVQQKSGTGQTELIHSNRVRVLHLLGGVSIPSVVVILTVLLSPEPTDFTIFLEFLGTVLQRVFGEISPEMENNRTVSQLPHSEHKLSKSRKRNNTSDV